ncbi:MAG: SPOR domain-containing protein [Spirochaetales bacterium]|nr:SPOR domain-containing protein [Spirochaetales bacterium]
MESKHILIVIICICAFLVVVFGVGFWWTLPELEKQTDSAGGDRSGTSYDIIQHTRSESEPIGLKPTAAPSETMEITYGEKEERDAGETADELSEEESEKTKETEVKTEAEKNDTKKEEPTNKEEKQEKVVIRVERKKETYPKVWVEKPEATKKITAAPTPAPRKEKRVIEYWIQIGAYKSKSKSEEQNEKLLQHGFQARIQTKDVNGTTYYRVRIGPYRNKAEAEKFLSWIKVIDGMEDSYISEVPTQKHTN